ncbi:MAG: tail fiber domain-containing protein [Bacteroidota bacterium]
MQKTLLLSPFLFWVFTINAQNVGIGTTTPLARLHVKDSNVVFSATGLAPASPGNPPISGKGRRMMWYADKGAFRVGYVDDSQWDKDNIGSYSFAAGYNAKAKDAVTIALGAMSEASGYSSTAIGSDALATQPHAVAIGSGASALALRSLAMGYATKASGNYSTAIGSQTQATGDFSIAFGSESLASGGYSTALGLSALANGNASTAIGGAAKSNAEYSIAIGESVTSNSWISTSLGRHNDPIVALPTNTWNLLEPLLIIGNGTGSSDKKNAFVIAKNGHVYIDPSNKNNGTLEGNSLIFGDYNTSVAGINSKRTATENQNGLDFYTGSNIRMSISNSGNIGIGNTTPSAPLTFANTTGTKISLYNGTANSYYGFGVEAYQLQLFADNVLARISFGYYAGGVFTERMHLNNNTGILNVSGVNYASDERYKKQITPIENSLEKIQAINGVEYYMRADEFPSKHFNNNLQVGLVAQEVEKVLPQAVQTNEEGFKAIDYARVVPLLVEGIKAQQKEINELKRQVEKLTGKH